LRSFFEFFLIYSSTNSLANSDAYINDDMRTGIVSYRFSHMSMTIIDCVVFHMVLWDINDRKRILTFRLVLALTWLSEAEDSI
jgi:hypothetical protein